MPKIEKINIELIGVGKAFMMNKILTVPIYQRSYSWQEKHVSDLIIDIENAIDNAEPEYFLGSIVTTKSTTDSPEVVDGQQRLATSIILLAAIRDYYLSKGDNDRANHIANHYLYDKNLATLEIRPKLKLNNIDNDYFEKRILSEPNSKERLIRASKDSHEKMLKAAELAKIQVDKISKSSSAVQRLADWVEYLQESLKVIWVSAPDEANAFTIFETLNDRGLNLAISDLLKNYLFGLSAERINEAQQRWTSMMGILETIEDEEIVVTFIRHLWSSKYGLVREKDLYSDIKSKIKTKVNAVDFASELAEGARLYVAMLNSSNELWEKYGPNTRDHVRILNLLRMSQIRPLFLSILSKFSVTETQKALRLMISWATRFLVVGGLGGGTLETYYSGAGKEISEGKITDMKQLNEKLKSIIPSDVVFRNAFEVASVSKSYLARYYLRAIEKQAKGDEHPELIPNENAEVVNLEHILPQNPSKGWNAIPKDEQEAYVNRIGNLTLLSKKIHSDLGNDSFPFKKKYYKKSKFLITSQIVKETTWDKSTIESRQKKMAGLAVKAWPLK